MNKSLRRFKCDSNPRPYACLAMAACAFFGWPAAAPAQDQREIDRQIEELEQVGPLMEQLEADLRAAAQQIEAEEQALLDRLGRTHDELQRERERSRQLETQLNGLLRAPAAEPPPTDTAEVAPPTGLRWVKHPARIVSPLGLVRATDDRLTDLPLGVNGLRLRLPEPFNTDADFVAVRAVSHGDRVALEVPYATVGSMELAVLSIEDGALRWRWHAFSPSRINEALADLDARLRLATIETRMDGVAWTRYQFAPVRLTIEPRADLGVPLDLPAGVAAELVSPRAGPGWAVLEQSPRQTTWVGRGSSVSLVLDTTHNTVAATRGPGLTEKLEDLGRQRKAWASDLNSPPVPGAAAGVDTARITAHLQLLAESETRLTQILGQLDAAPGTPVTLEASAGSGGDETLAVDVAARDAGIVLYRINVSSLPR